MPWTLTVLKHLFVCYGRKWAQNADSGLQATEFKTPNQRESDSDLNPSLCTCTFTFPIQGLVYTSFALIHISSVFGKFVYKVR